MSAIDILVLCTIIPRRASAVCHKSKAFSDKLTVFTSPADTLKLSIDA